MILIVFASTLSIVFTSLAESVFIVTFRRVSGESVLRLQAILGHVKCEGKGSLPEKYTIIGKSNKFFGGLA